MSKGRINYTINLEEFESECNRLRDEYIDTAYETQQQVIDMETYFEQANQVEMCRRAVRNYLENNGKFTDEAFEG